MKIRMLEHFQGRGMPSLSKDEEHTVGEKVDGSLAEWLVDTQQSRSYRKQGTAAGRTQRRTLRLATFDR